jgi:hypothetical protein
MDKEGLQIKTKQDIINIIKREIPFVGKRPYSHNIINLELNILDERYGEKEVVELIKNTDLKILGWGHIITIYEQKLAEEEMVEIQKWESWKGK